MPAKSRAIPPKKFDFSGFEGHTELFGPHPFTWKTPTPPENIRTQKFGFGFLFFVPDGPLRGSSCRNLALFGCGSLGANALLGPYPFSLCVFLRRATGFCEKKPFARTPFFLVLDSHGGTADEHVSRRSVGEALHELLHLMPTDASCSLGM